MNDKPVALPFQPRPGPWRISFSLLGAPVAWIVLMMLNPTLASYACYPFDTPLPHPLWSGLKPGLSIVGLACLAVASAACVSAWRAFNAVDRAPRVSAWRQFLLLLAVLSSSIFTAANIFSLAAIILVPACHPWK